MSLPGLSKSQASKIFTSRTLPTGITTAASDYSPARFVYNLKPKHLAKFRSAAVKATAGVAGEYDVNFIGNSIMRGAGVTSPTNYGERSWVAQFRKLAAARGLTAAGESSGYVPAMSGGGLADSRHTLVGAWGSVSGVNTLLQQTVAGPGASWTWSSGAATGTIVEFLYADTSSPLNVSIDGGAAVTITPTNTNTIKRYQVTGLASTTHTVAVTPSNANGMYVGAFRVRTATALNFNNWGHYGAKASTLGSQASQPFGILGAVNANTTPVATFIDMMTNEVAGGSPISATQYKAEVNALITNLTNPGDIVLCASIPGNVAQDYTAHRQALYEIADTRDLPVIDFYPRYVDGMTMAANGLLSDTLHSNPAGYLDMGMIVAGAVL